MLMQVCLGRTFLRDPLVMVKRDVGRFKSLLSLTCMLVTRTAHIQVSQAGARLDSCVPGVVYILVSASSSNNNLCVAIYPRSASIDLIILSFTLNQILRIC